MRQKHRPKNIVGCSFTKFDEVQQMRHPFYSYYVVNGVKQHCATQSVNL